MTDKDDQMPTEPAAPTASTKAGATTPAPAPAPTKIEPVETPGPNLGTVNLGDLISLFYDEFLALYGDEERASVAAAQVINDLLASKPEDYES